MADESEGDESGSSYQSPYQDVSSDDSGSADDTKRRPKPKHGESNISSPSRKRSLGNEAATHTSQEVKPSQVMAKSVSLPVAKKRKKPKSATNTSGTFEILVPSSGAESLLFVQLDGAENETVHLEGAIGAIGRLEQVDNSSVFFDIQGVQYSGTLLPGPSMLLLTENGSDLRVEGVADDFVLATCKESSKEHLNAMSTTFMHSEDDVNTRGVKAEADVAKHKMPK